MAPKKILFMPMPMKGHLCHTARIAEWYLMHPSEYEVHIACSPDAGPYFPEDITFHANPDQLTESECSEIFGAVSEARTQTESVAIMFEKADLSRIAASTKTLMHLVQRIKPDVVIFEHAHNVGNCMHTFCESNGIPHIMLVAMARPETALNPLVLLRVLLGSPRRRWRIVKALMDIPKQLEPVVGRKPLPESDVPVTLFPGAQVLCELPAKPHEIYTGPFYPLPLQTSSPKARLLKKSSTSKFSLALDSAPDLSEWMQKKCDADLPLIYIGMGTLAVPPRKLIENIIEALDNGPWAIIWALSETHQELLPRKLSDQWYVDKFLPQVAIFQTQTVKCFMSHCGGSSTTESITNGIPMVCIPFFGDQVEWAESISSHVKAGIKLDKFKSSSEDMKLAVQRVLQDETYSRNAHLAAEKMISNAQMRLDFLGAKIDGQTRAGVPVAVAMIEKSLMGKDPREVLPPELRAHPPKKSWLCAWCK